MLLVAMSLLLRGMAYAEEGPLPKGWPANLQPLVELFASESSAVSPREASYLATLQADIREAELILVYFDLTTRLSSQEQARLTSEQSLWQTSQSRCNTETSGESENDGHIAQRLCTLGYIKRIEERISELRRRLKAWPNASPTIHVASTVLTGWQPNLTRAFAWLQQDSEDGPIIAIERNRCMQAQVCDVELALVYLQIWLHRNKNERIALKQEQMQWLAMRTKRMNATAKSEHDETLAALRSHRTSIELTQKRTVELRQRLPQAGNLRPAPLTCQGVTR